MTLVAEAGVFATRGWNLIASVGAEFELNLIDALVRGREEEISAVMKEGIILWIINMGVILSVFYWSGQSAEKIVYDRYLARLESVEIQVSDKITAATFFAEVLDLKQAKVADDEFFLPDNRKLLLRESSDGARAHLLLRVRNGFERLHQVFKQNISENKLGTLSEIKDEAFIVSDPSGNRFTFLAWR